MNPYQYFEHCRWRLQIDIILLQAVIAVERRLFFVKLIQALMLIVMGAGVGLNGGLAIGYVLQAFVPDQIPFRLPLNYVLYALAYAIATTLISTFWRRRGFKWMMGL